MKRLTAFVICLGLVFLSGTSSARKIHTSKKLELKSGDIVFQYIPCGDLCQAIVETTPCNAQHPFNHCGIVVKKGHSISVIEAIGKNVHATPLKSFLEREKGNALFVGRVRRKHTSLKAAIQHAKALLGRPYDDAFLPGDSALYCSELVYECYRSKGKPVFTLKPMTFISPRNKTTYPAWVDYYKGIARAIPEGLPGINPCAIANSADIRLIELKKSELQGE